MTIDFDRIKAICFDFDGTLARFQGDFLKLSQETLNDLGLPKHRFEDCMRQFNIAQFKEGESTLSQILSQALEVLGLQTDTDIDATANTMTASYVSQIKLLDGAKEILETLHHPLAIITNGPMDMQHAAIDAVHIRHYFDAVIVSGDAEVAVRKPNPRIFDIACKRLGTTPEQCLMVGDNLEADVKGALNFGMQGIYIESKGIVSKDVLSVRNTKALSELLLNGLGLS